MSFSTTEITSHEIISDNPIHQRLLFAYYEATNITKGQLLEVGCGVGRGIAILSEACDKYTGIDKNEQLIEQLRQTYPNALFIGQNVPPLQKIPTESYDTVVAFQVIEHIEDDNLFVKELHRVLKPEGKLIITTPNIKRSLTRNPWHVREYKAQELISLMKKYFTKLQTFGVQGNEKVETYMEQNKKAVEKITKYDILNLQYRLPRALLQIPYDILNRMNRKKLMDSNTGLVNEIQYTDYFLDDNIETCLDFFYVAEKCNC
ncbi:class I SAM-dependent methyltransferase [Xanthocytophaga agilis]|uniref:Class I SAM-dependent methyltransferase n=1 Tax=Xanthocytophaga agilis TaxID=3048010 RepID=A0AAE3UEM1_9BACT|nr:class I SAM-dependent methyltransferase [Xanthocytophaga agilis]MDJ1502380.1 class I SAM-dependent methyltransferase [Xanthocytophaga agilis]